MKYLPFENITYRTQLKDAEVIKRLSKMIESKGASAYEGSLQGNKFSMVRIINYRNSFLPKINGTIVQECDGTVILVKMKLNTFIFIFIALWLLIVLILGIGFLFLSFIDDSVKGWFLVPIGMFIFGYGLTLGAFKYESTKSKRFFEELFEARAIV